MGKQVKLVQVILQEGPAGKAGMALAKRRKLPFWKRLAFAADYTGPTFIGTKDQSVELFIATATVNITVDNPEDGRVEYIYPMHDVARVKVIHY